MEPRPPSSAVNRVIVRRDRPELHRLLQAALAGLAVEVEWDRRRADRRAGGLEPERERRGRDRRRRAPDSWALGATVVPAGAARPTLLA
jgi:hypothetical protein